jgi:NADH-quinone oxidoreductase subunit L
LIPEIAIWLIFFLPIMGFLAIGLLVRPFFGGQSRLSSLILIGALSGSFVLSVWALRCVIEEGPLTFLAHDWMTVGGLEFKVGLIVDSLTAIMLVVVSAVSLAIQIYSHGYMKGDPGYVRYYAFMALFSSAMIGLVISSNIIQMFVMWELVGLGSFLLIGFWFNKPAAAAAAKKAFLVTRIGDFGFLLAILYLFAQKEAFAGHGLNPLEIQDINSAMPMIKDGIILGISSLSLTWLGLGIFAGAAGKSAQFPLHVWLPDAMEGPTPVSALIHAATMVAAGVFLIARFFPVFQSADTTMTVLAILGSFTAIFAATMAIVNNDIKRVLAYSTISQLGYMVAALGIGAYGPAIFHLFNHAFFKALLFLGAGNVNHATGTFDMRYMGGLRKIMPLTYASMVIGGLSLIGIFPLAGFWSKDEILGYAWHGNGFVNGWVFWVLMLGMILTAVYTTRMMLMTFHGQYRGDSFINDYEEKKQIMADGNHHLKESPLVMLAPMGLLAIAAIFSGYIANPQRELLGIPVHWFSEFVAPLGSHEHLLPLNQGLALVTMTVAVILVGLVCLFYARNWKGGTRFQRTVMVGRQVLTERYYIDRVFERGLVNRLFYRFTGGFLEWIDQQIIDAIVDVVGWVSRSLGLVISRFQTGQVQVYGMTAVAGAFVVLVSYLMWS